MKKELLDHPTKGVYCRPTRPFAKKKSSENMIYTFPSRQGATAFPPAKSLRSSDHKASPKKK